MIIKRLEELNEEELEVILNRQLDIEGVLEDVNAIIMKVAESGDQALRDYTERFDGARLDEIRVSQEEIEEAYNRVDEDLMASLEEAAENILIFHQAQRDRDLWMMEIAPGVLVGQKVVPLDSVGAYVPGGRAAYPSSALMTVIPAQVAGVERIALCTPPGPDGRVKDLTLVAADMAGADEIYKLGGAQAIAAMALGTETVPRVDKIVGPGNIYVTAAKMLVRNNVEIDFPAGPSEVLIVADESATPSILAADMMAQAEHDPNSVSVLVTTSQDMAFSVAEYLKSMIPLAERREIVEQSLVKGMILVVSDLEEAMNFANSFAPEHLQIVVHDTTAALDMVRHAGSVFLGPYTPVAAGDYASGTNHVLPTSGFARVFSGLSVDHFTRKITVQRISREGLAEIGSCIVSLAKAEGLTAHARSVEKRLEEK